METYIVLVNFTQQGIAKIKESPAWIDAARQAVEEAGGKWLGWYLTMGRYDVVLIVQAFDSKIIASVTLAMEHRAMFAPRPCLPLLRRSSGKCLPVCRNHPGI
jgi:uncharacterized protein with GYD domain